MLLLSFEINIGCSVLEALGLIGESNLSALEKEAVEVELKYAGFVKRQQKELLHMEAQHGRRLPADLDYQSISTLSLESREKLARVSLWQHLSGSWQVLGAFAHNVLANLSQNDSFRTSTSH